MNYDIKKSEKNWKLFIAITESNPNWKDRETGQPYLHTYTTQSLEEWDHYSNLVIDNYIDLYIECNSEYPEDIHHRMKWNDWKGFYFDKFSWTLDWDNIRVKKEIRDFTWVKTE